MIITYLRSSSYSTWDMCPLSYYLQYTTGHAQKPNYKTVKGSIVHLTLETLAICRKIAQQGGNTYHDEIFGTLNFEIVNGILHFTNTTINLISDSSYNHFSSHVDYYAWKEKDRIDCQDWTFNLINLQDGEYSPLKREVIDSERQFDFELTEDWAKFDYDGIKGQLSLKGTIDNISKIDDETYEIIDYKTGRRWNWAKNTEKTFESLMSEDMQFRMYHLAIADMYPNIKDFLITVIYMNDGGAITLAFGEKDKIKTKEMLRKRFETIKNTTIPRANKTWKCKAFCYYYKNTFKGTHVPVGVEHRSGQLTKRGEKQSMCEETLFFLQKFGEPKTTENLTVPGFSVHNYQKPGEV